MSDDFLLNAILAPAELPSFVRRGDVRVDLGAQRGRPWFSGAPGPGQRVALELQLHEQMLTFGEGDPVTSWVLLQGSLVELQDRIGVENATVSTDSCPLELRGSWRAICEQHPDGHWAMTQLWPQPAPQSSR